MYKFSDFSDEIWRRTLMLFSNHLFFLFFLFFVVFMGTFGIWVTPTFISDPFTWEGLLNSFTPISLISFSLPLLVTLIFDKMVSTLRKKEIEDIPLAIWLGFLLFIMLTIITFLFIFGYKSGDKFTWYAFFAWIFVLYIWVLANVDNPNYQKPDEPNSASGGENVTKSLLKDGSK
jgi:hypothetical protein